MVEKSIQSLLTLNEECHFAAKVLDVTKESSLIEKEQECTICLVKNKSIDEYALFYLQRSSPTTYSISSIIPVHRDLEYKLIDLTKAQSNVPELVLDIGEFKFQSLKESMNNNSFSLLLTGLVQAKQGSSCLSNESHQWLDLYEKRILPPSNPPLKKESDDAILVDGDSFSPDNFNEMKSSWIAKQLKARENDYTHEHPIAIFCGTYNVNGRKPMENLEEWLRPDEHAPSPDIYCLGFQELDLTAEALLLGDTSRSVPWEHMIHQTLIQWGDYAVYATKQLVGILLLIFVKGEHFPYLSNLQHDLCAVGIMGIMGNKGGIGIRFNFHHTSLCFVNSHLNAHMDNIPRRNQDFREISTRIKFTDPKTHQQITMFDHDYLFWIGDLNYRIQAKNEYVRAKIKEKDYETLLNYDQLKAQIKTGAAFHTFCEAPIAFEPSYKYDPGTSNYDTSEKHRVPSYTDRVLFKTIAGRSLTISNYNRRELYDSDHRPVYCHFQVVCKSIIPEKLSQVNRQLLQELDHFENDLLPAASISINNLHFDEAKYMVPLSQTIEIENCGQVFCKYRFIPKYMEKDICPSWLWVTPTQGFLPPGEKGLIHITVNVDNKTIQELHEKEDRNTPPDAQPKIAKRLFSLEDILILHLENGKDFFVSVTATHLPSFFGSSLKHLVRFPNPIRTSTPLPMGDPRCLPIPKELWRIVDYLYRKGMDKEELFLQSGSQDMSIIHECLDLGQTFDNLHFHIHSMAETFIRFLESLPEPIIPFSLYQKVIDSSYSLQLSKQVVYCLNSIHYNVFFYIITFLREILTHAENNHLTQSILSVCFAGIMIRPPPNHPQTTENKQTILRKKADFLNHFLGKDQILKNPIATKKFS